MAVLCCHDSAGLSQVEPQTSTSASSILTLLQSVGRAGPAAAAAPGDSESDTAQALRVPLALARSHEMFCHGKGTLGLIIIP
eukprot:747530-Hanusia_phi.AAC.2